MTGTEWIELVEWVEARFPKGWTTEQAVAYHDDVKAEDPTDVWAGLQQWYERGQRFPPTGSVLLVEARKQASARSRPELQSLPPESVTAPRSSWAEYTAKRFGEPLTPQETIERIHQQLIDSGKKVDKP